MRKQKNGPPYIDDWDEELYDILLSRFDELQKGRKLDAFQNFIETKHSLLESYGETVKEPRYKKEDMHGILAGISDIKTTDAMLEFILPNLIFTYLLWICKAINENSLNDKQKKLLKNLCYKHFTNISDQDLPSLLEIIEAVTTEESKEKKARENASQRTPSTKEKNYATLVRVLSQFLDNNVKYPDRVCFISNFKVLDKEALITAFVLNLCEEYTHNRYRMDVAFEVKESVHSFLQKTAEKATLPILIQLRDRLDKRPKAAQAVRAIDIYEAMCRKAFYIERIKKRAQNRTPINLVDLHEVVICLNSNLTSIKTALGISPGDMPFEIDELVYLTKEDISKIVERQHSESVRKLPSGISTNIPIVIRCVPMLGLFLIIEMQYPKGFLFKVIDTLGLFYCGNTHGTVDKANKGIPHVVELPVAQRTSTFADRMADYEDAIGHYELCVALAKSVLTDIEGNALLYCKELLGEDTDDAPDMEDRTLLHQYASFFNIPGKTVQKNGWMISTQNGLIEKTTQLFYAQNETLTPDQEKWRHYHDTGFTQIIQDASNRSENSADLKK